MIPNRLNSGKLVVGLTLIFTPVLTKKSLHLPSQRSLIIRSFKLVDALMTLEKSLSFTRFWKAVITVSLATVVLSLLLLGSNVGFMW